MNPHEKKDHSFNNNQEKGVWISKITKIIDWDSAIAEPPSGLVRVEISTVGQAVGTCERPEEIVGAGVDGGVADDE
jgi:hypothetical protein